jgi:M6 family metalloprotease-like protein
MKKSLLFCALAMTSALSLKAIIANPEARRYTQPDGSTVELTLHGDETYNYTTTAEGLTVIFNTASATWEYANIANGQLVTTGIAAADKRPATLSADITPGLLPQMTEQEKTLRAKLNSMVVAKPRLHNGTKFDYSKFRGLIILVQYNDMEFSRSDYYDVISEMVNKKGYEGYMTNAMIPTLVPCTGSVYDYFSENSEQQFTPSFDIVGPVTIDYSRYYAQKSTYAQTLVKAALNAANSQVNYADYDTDGDGTVDMVFFIFAGAGSNYSGNSSSLIWPHASTVESLSLDGVKFGRYACSTELYGAEATTILDGIGTICHEFSHVLGLPDLYDTDYTSSGGTSTHPIRWSIMATGSYNNSSKTPAGYSIYERYALGFTSPKVISDPGTYTLEPISSSNAGYRINSGVDNEFFLLESRSQTRWDEYLKGEGMLVWRVDSTNVDVWENNKVNCNPKHNYLELLRANPTTSSGSITDSAGDPFPGSGNVTSLTNTTDPSLCSWTLLPTSVEINDITRSADGSVSFTLSTASAASMKEDFEIMEPTSADTLGVDGRFTKWDFINGARIATVDDNTAVALVKGASVQFYPFGRQINSVQATLTNSSTSTANIRCYYSIDGSSWTLLSNMNGTVATSVAAGATVEAQYNLAALNVDTSTIMIRFTELLGNASKPCYLDDVTLVVAGGSDYSGVDSIDNNPDNTAAEYFDLYGRRIANPGQGLYIVRRGSKVNKQILR